MSPSIVEFISTKHLSARKKKKTDCPQHSGSAMCRCRASRAERTRRTDKQRRGVFSRMALRIARAIPLRRVAKGRGRGAGA